MIILGISMGEICSACLIKNDKILGASYEERFHRKKSLSGFPHKTVEYLLSSNNLKTTDLDKVAIINEVTSGLELSLVQRLNSFTIEDFINEAHQYWYPKLYNNKSINYVELFNHKIDENIYPKKILNLIKNDGENFKTSKEIRIKIVKEALKLEKIDICFIEHHFSHALYGLLFLPNKTDNTLIFTADSFGDYSNSNVYKTKNGIIENIFTSSIQNLGRLYRNITLLLGMKPYQHEYKVMGLAPYADCKYANQVKNIFEQYMYGFDKDWLFKKIPKDHYFEFKKLLEGYRFDNIAGGLQLYFEERLLDWFNYFLKNDDLHKTVVFSGGLSMNVKANLRLEKLCQKYGKEFYCAPSGDDYSHAISSAFAVLFETEKNKKYSFKDVNLSRLDLGYFFSKSDEKKITAWCKKTNYSVLNLDFKAVAEFLNKNKVLALCHGNAEFGARALGFRSIIADPTNFHTINKINKAIKMRDFWMPFAPAILKGYEDKYSLLKNWKNHRFMASSADTSELGVTKLRAASHPYDNTIRPMIVTKDSNEIFYKLIESFGNLSGTFALLNTSLNLHGLPIVNNADDLIHVLENSEIDGVVTENYFIIKNT